MGRVKAPSLRNVALTDRDEADLVAFREGLTDRSVTTGPRFADPLARGSGHG
ncbi:hypothetical protein [Baekduia soli]|uniref:hypothetical protein n=1 Tax=Baekduia soli TaxID=496014 RepID=UPI001651C319|nr:hypothetical protein [Baekduia soli]